MKNTTTRTATAAENRTHDTNDTMNTRKEEKEMSNMKHTENGRTVFANANTYSETREKVSYMTEDGRVTEYTESAYDAEEKRRLLEAKHGSTESRLTGIVPRLELHAKKGVSYDLKKSELRDYRRAAGVRLSDGEMKLKERLEKAEKAEKARAEKVMTWEEWETADDAKKEKELRFMVLHCAFLAMVKGKRSYRETRGGLADIVAEAWLTLYSMTEEEKNDARGFRYVLSVACGRALDRVHDKNSNSRKESVFSAYDTDGDDSGAERAILAHARFCPTDATARGIEYADAFAAFLASLNQTEYSIAETLLDAETVTMSRCAELCGMSRKTLYKHVSRMREKALVSMEAAGDMDTAAYYAEAAERDLNTAKLFVQEDDLIHVKRCHADATRYAFAALLARCGDIVGYYDAENMPL